MSRQRDLSTTPSEGVSQPYAKSAHTRQRIIDSAARVLYEKGYSGTRLSDVAADSGVGVANIYYYFPSRDELIAQVMLAGMEEGRASLQESLGKLPDSAPPMERLMVAVEVHLRGGIRRSPHAQAVVRNAQQLPEPLLRRQREADSAYGAVWRDLIEELESRGELRDGLDPFAAQMLVIGALNSALEWWNRRRGTIDNVVRSAQIVVRHGLSASVG
ncbi:TetR/AcrR family transcriptional regulator [Aeromicrobium fastidiosum]|uniref:TetR/AcrR family transcriptional regulator n=1 Tax=Aeromicrobium fastidiosum TaxID=52699 RepID=A0A641AIN2_9ACTN|nr:TetR/AcrR family transcriptional regulator [Aeromicrobium fastidiosum]KAA1373093.1 TetR/AcrR family transcriptional regulator [Aeromicrobium fastidiosum]MBP2391078.1 AcrR family transcriptional regulator [Aeromicrobium fastidiosum]